MMEAKFNVTETDLDKLGVLVLDENEAMDTDGGNGHWEIENGNLVWIED